jgi:hypothetical protein
MVTGSSLPDMVALLVPRNFSTCTDESDISDSFRCGLVHYALIRGIKHGDILALNQGK